MKKVRKSEQEWKKVLTDEEYTILRKKGTEPPFSGKLLHETRKGIFRCAGCGNPLFRSDDKFNSGSGWPSFTQPIADETIEKQMDQSHGMKRTEILCSVCKGHLGHVFPDGPSHTGLRYCINSIALKFKEED